MWIGNLRVTSDILKSQYKIVTLCELLSGIEDPCEVAFVSTKCWYETDPNVSHWPYFNFQDESINTRTLGNSLYLKLIKMLNFASFVTDVSDLTGRPGCYNLSTNIPIYLTYKFVSFLAVNKGGKDRPNGL
jgi:hypothetical protein